MKTKILLTVSMIGMIMGTFAQKPTMILTFTADDNGQHVPLNSILIENLTQGGDTTLYAPDTVLALDYIIGINESIPFDDNSISLSQNFPNPMKGRTTVRLYLPEEENILITVSDVTGREMVNSEFCMERGKHSFTFYPGRESLYFLTASTDRQSRTIKMFNSPGYASVRESCKLEYNGTKSGSGEYKTREMLNNFVFDLGDQLQYTASSALGVRIIIDTPSANQTYTFQYGSGGMPCPGMPTITDIDGNVYNTILIGDQCWMKENLKTTTYNNGASIPNVTDGADWSNLISDAYVWYDNDISWKDSYGALYNWYATIDPGALCPTGWHVPGHDEWEVLFEYIGGTLPPHGNELKSCRQVNSPAGGNCSTNEHPRWAENDSFWGTDEYGLSGLPGGFRQYNGEFNDVGKYSVWWSSSEYSSDFAWSQTLSYNDGTVYVSSSKKASGLSIRCLRD